MNKVESSYDIYLAGPFFSDDQKKVMAEVRKGLEDIGFKVCDPQELSPVIVDLPEEQRNEQLFKEIFQNNIDGLYRSRITVACIDGRDAGTMFEIGYSCAIENTIVTFSDKGFGSNVMISQAAQGHFNSVSKLLSAMKGFYYNGESFLDEQKAKVLE